MTEDEHRRGLASTLIEDTAERLRKELEHRLLVEAEPSRGDR